MPKAIAAPSIFEQSRFEGYERDIETGLSALHSMGVALRAIRDERLHLPAYRTFESYCQERWQMSARRAYQIMAAATVIDNVDSPQSPTHEAHTRILAALEPEAQAIVWNVVADTAPDGNVTAAHVKSVVNVFREVMTTGAIDPGTGEQIPVAEAVKMAITEETYERHQRQRQHLRDGQTRQYQRQHGLEGEQVIHIYAVVGQPQRLYAALVEQLPTGDFERLRDYFLNE
jgi:hypothetical protein